MRRLASRLVRTTLVVGAASAALSLAGPDALLPFRDAAAAAATVGVAFVVDFGSGAPVVGCVQVPPSDNGYFALAAFAQQENVAAPAYNNAGLLCSIGGIPVSGCGTPGPNGQYFFWSYWHGATGSWSYSSVGAFADVQTGDVEGWRFQNPGPDNASAPAPRAAPDYAAICSSTTTATTSGPTATSSPAPSAASSSGGNGSGSPNASSGSSGSSPTATDAPVSAAGGSATAHESGPGGAASSATTTSAPVRVATPPAHAPQGGAPAAALGPTPARGRGSGGGNSALPLAIGGVLVLALAAAAVWRWRVRPRTP